MIDAFAAAGCDVQVGPRLPQLFGGAGIGAPDGTDVAGRLEPLVDGPEMLVAVYKGLLPTAIGRGITTEERSAALLSHLATTSRGFPTRPCCGRC